MAEARCVRYHPDWSYVDLLFHPDHVGGGPTKEYSERRLREARRCCALCPVRRDCLTEALTTNPEGIWGGTTSEERRAVRNLPMPERVATLEAQVESRLHELLAPHERRERVEDSAA
jgi:hypothetical protein